MVDYTFKKKEHVITMAHKVSLNVDSKSINVDPQLLFQRLALAAGDDTEEAADIFQFELCSHPSALLEQSELLREANKPLLSLRQFGI